MRRNRRKRRLRRAPRVSEQEPDQRTRAAASGPPAPPQQGRLTRTGIHLGQDRMKEQSSPQTTATFQRHKAQVLTCVKIQMCSLSGVQSSHHRRSLAPERIHSGAKCPSHERNTPKVRQGTRSSSRRGTVWRQQHPSGAAGAHKCPSR